MGILPIIENIRAILIRSDNEDIYGDIMLVTEFKSDTRTIDNIWEKHIASNKYSNALKDVSYLTSTLLHPKSSHPC